MRDAPAYGLWLLVIINSLVFIIFAFSFMRPRTSRDWRSFDGFVAFIIALFTEMYGFPLTIYLLSGWLGSGQRWEILTARKQFSASDCRISHSSARRPLQPRTDASANTRSYEQARPLL